MINDQDIKIDVLVRNDPDSPLLYSQEQVSAPDLGYLRAMFNRSSQTSHLQHPVGSRLVHLIAFSSQTVNQGSTYMLPSGHIVCEFCHASMRHELFHVHEILSGMFSLGEEQITPSEYGAAVFATIGDEGSLLETAAASLLSFHDIFSQPLYPWTSHSQLDQDVSAQGL